MWDFLNCCFHFIVYLYGGITIILAEYGRPQVRCGCRFQAQPPVRMFMKNRDFRSDGLLSPGTKISETFDTKNLIKNKEKKRSQLYMEYYR